MLYLFLLYKLNFKENYECVNMSNVSISVERKKALEEEKEKKLDEITALKEQYDSALQLKQSRIASEIETEIKLIQFNLSVENARDKLIEKEA
jgi:hypothetical protein